MSGSDRQVQPQKLGEEKGDIPAPRFGHTATLVGNNKVILFGGATGDSGRYTITADTYNLDLETRTWSRIVPEPGAAPPKKKKPKRPCRDRLSIGPITTDRLYYLGFL